MQKRSLLVVGLLVLAVIIIIAFISINIQTETGPIKIGFISVLSGEAVSYGETERNATEMAVAEINDNGGIDGRRVEVIYEDGKCNGKEALSAVNKLITADKVKVILGATCSSETLAIIPVIDENKVVLFSGGSSHPSLTGISKYFFRNFPSDLANGTVDGETMAKLYKKVAIISESADYPIGVKNIIISIFKEKGIEVVFNENYSSGLKDFRTLMSKVKNSGAEAVYLNPNPATNIQGLMVKQAREMGLTIPIHGNSSFMATETIKNGGSYMEGIISSENSTLSEKGMVIVDKYKKIYGKDPISLLLGTSYDRVYIITDAIKKVGYDSDKIVNYVQNMKEYDGAIGKYHFDKNGDMVGVGFVSVIIKDGKGVPYIK